jgi:hypothetical protein
MLLMKEKFFKKILLHPELLAKPLCLTNRANNKDIPICPGQYSTTSGGKDAHGKKEKFLQKSFHRRNF